MRVEATDMSAGAARDSLLCGIPSAFAHINSAAGRPTGSLGNSFRQYSAWFPTPLPYDRAAGAFGSADFETRTSAARKPRRRQILRHPPGDHLASEIFPLRPLQ